MSKPIPWIVCGLLLAACSGDDDDGGGSAGSDAGGSQSAAGSSGSSAGGSNAGGSGGSNAGGSGGRGGSGGAGSGGSTAGTGGSSAGTGGSSAGTGGSSAGTGGSAGTDAGQDAGTDSGMPSTATVCKAPTTNASSGNTCPAGDPPALKLTPIKTGLDVPIFVTQPPNDDSRLFVVLRSGRILIVDPATGADMGELINVPQVAAGGEMGLLGMAFHPDFPEDPRFFVYFSRDETQHESVIASFEVMEDDPDKADPATKVELFKFNQPQSNHNGGMLAFGPDGCLFVGSGDGGNSNDEGSGHPPAGNGQTLSTPLGKILRIDVDKPMMSAPGNLGGAGTNIHVWDYGMRNPWRFSFDRTKGDMYIGDVGQGTWEEVDVEPKGAGKKNYGWKVMEGAHCFGGGCDMDGLVLPIHEYGHGGGDDCIIGGYVYRGSKIAALQGWYLFADNGPGPGPMGSSPRSVWALVWDGTKSCQQDPPEISELNDFNIYSDITSFGEDSKGELYLTTMNAVYRIDPM